MTLWAPVASRGGFVHRTVLPFCMTLHSVLFNVTPQSFFWVNYNTPVEPKLHGGVCMSGDVLLSHRFPPAVPSALKSLASGFGMEPGVSPSP